MTYKHNPQFVRASIRTLTLLLVTAAFVLAPLSSAWSQDEMPELEGTTYGAMLSDLRDQVDELARASEGDEQTEAMVRTVNLMAEQNATMIRMIDALHDKVNGVVNEDRSLVNSGSQKFNQLDDRYHEFSVLCARNAQDAGRCAQR